MKKRYILLSLLMAGTVLTSNAKTNLKAMLVYTDKANSFVRSKVNTAPLNGVSDITINIVPNSKTIKQKVKGFGACFNELGWTSLNMLSESSRESIMRELFEPNYGANFTYCRMPVGANDFSRDWYSYDESDGDFTMSKFSIENDKQTLIPFIKQALSFNGKLTIWASPWAPPSWMKYNKHYASAYNGYIKEDKYKNGLPADKVGKEGTDMFIQKPEYLKAYALYFKKFIQAYREEGINISAVMPQNEFNSAQVFPSCCWTAHGLANFVGNYLGPTMKKENVKVMFGTVERANYLLVDTLLRDKKAAKYIKGVGFQWAGRDAIVSIHKNYPKLFLLQTEQECGNGKNDWKGLLHSWELLRHYFNNGVSAYDYWNISLEKGGISRWGWAQNSLVVVDSKNKTYNYTYEYYLMKHISHFVKPGAVLVETNQSANSLTFINKDKSVVILYVNETDSDMNVNVNYKKYNDVVSVRANSINTIILN